MKNLFYGMMAAIMMIATSCESVSDINVVEEGNLATVSFNLGTPQMGSRAEYSTGETATHLQYAVYDVDGNILDKYTVTNGDITGGSKEVKFQLTIGNTYYVLFWAAAPNAPYNVNLAAKTMEVSYAGAVSNDENRDAFYYYDDFTVERGMAPISAELKRPFAQLNIGTSDYAESKSAGYEVKYAKVRVPVYTTLNFVTGEASNKQTVVFDYAAIPTSYDFPVEPTTYQYMAMNYLLMNKTKETVDVTFTYATDYDAATGVATEEKPRVVGSVPVQRNHRTNLFGQLLTGEVVVNVVIKPGYDLPSEDKDITNDMQ